MEIINSVENGEGRKILYVDVGAMSSKEAKEYMSKLVKNKYGNNRKSRLKDIVEVVGIAGSFGGFL